MYQMATPNTFSNRVRDYRISLDLTQARLAERAGISRTAVTAIEAERLVPSVAAALALAEVLGTTVELLFGQSDDAGESPAWAMDPHSTSGAYWEAEVSGQKWRYPAESSPMLTPLPDGPSHDESPSMSRWSFMPKQTLVIACCDPAAGLLATEFARETRLRMLILPYSSRQALELLKQGKVHAAGLHLSTRDDPQRNIDLVRRMMGSDYQLLRIARWQEGIAVSSSSRIRSIRAAAKTKLKWIGREEGSGARQCLDRLLENRPAPRRLARNHRGVAEAVQAGWADAGVCVQLSSAEAGLDFLPVQEEAYELCIPNGLMEDARIQSLLRVVRSAEYRKLLGNLPGYDTSETGELAKVN